MTGILINEITSRQVQSYWFCFSLISVSETETTPVHSCNFIKELFVFGKKTSCSTYFLFLSVF